MKQSKHDLGVTMTIRNVGNGKPVERRNYYANTTRLEWVSIEKDENDEPLVRRAPRPKTMLYFSLLGFFAAGRYYTSWRQLIAEHDMGYEHCRDKYGREVVYAWEHFPCFDSYDYANEDRSRHWFLLRKGDRLTYIQAVDGAFFVHVTEDVQDIRYSCWSKLKDSGLMSGN